MGLRTGITALVCVAALVGCSREEKLEGERLDLRGAVDDAAQAASEQTNVALSLPAPSTNANWTHRGGNASHYISHPNLSANPKRIWTANIGKGSSKRSRLSSDPIIADGRIFTIDSNGLVSAFGSNGSTLWTQSVKADVVAKDETSGGGLAVNGSNLAVTTGFGEALLLDVATGQIKWRHKVFAAIASAPAINSSRMVVVGADNTALGLELTNGRISWQQKSVSNGSAVLGTGTPAISGKVAILPYTSGEVQGVALTTGLQAWSQIVSGRRIGDASSSISAVSGDPVIVGNRVYIGTRSGRLSAMDRRSGSRAWTAQEGAVGSIAVSGNSLFVVTDQRKLKRLNTSDGSEVWSVDLPLFRKVKRQKGSYAHFGPVLAGGRIYVAGSDGELRAFDPSNGEQVNSISIPSGAASQPAVAGGRLYILSENGQLHAFQ